jgi:hypothetical protein
MKIPREFFANFNNLGTNQYHLKYASNMGISSSSALDVRRSSVVQRVRDENATLAEILDYVNGEEAIEEVKQTINLNWSFRGSKANKENLVVMCAVATAGLGKTEMCRQCALSCDTFVSSLNGISVIVPVPISFNQSTSFSIAETSNPIDASIVWRALYQFGNSKERSEECTWTLLRLLTEIRRANCPSGKKPSSVAILLLVDEILKVHEKNEEFFRELLDVLTNLQQSQIRDELPTFVIITSLELIPVSTQIVRKSGRRLHLISMPFLREVDLDVTASKLYEHIRSVLCAERPALDALQLERFNNLRNLIRVAVSLSGRHFRTMEAAIKAVYTRLVSRLQHERAANLGLTLSLFTPNDGNLDVTEAEIASLSVKGKNIDNHRRFLDIFARKGACVDLSIKALFDSTVNEIELGQIDRDAYYDAKDLFLRLLVDPNLVVNEASVYALEAAKIVFVKSRNPDRMTEIIPRVSLPFLFLYPRANLSCRLAPAHSSVDYPRNEERETILQAKYVKLSRPSRLGHHTEMILNNIGVALSQSFSELSTAFEELMPFIELLLVAARPIELFPILHVEDILRGALFTPWDRESLRVSSFVRQAELAISSPAPDKADSHVDAVRVAVNCAKGDDCNCVYVPEQEQNMQCVEYISRLLSVGEEQVLCFCSMKLRAKTDPVAVALQLHQFVAANVVAQCDLLPKSYYAVIYCCTRTSAIDQSRIPPGTIIVTFECLHYTLYPFGLSQLLLTADEKSLL